MAAGLLRGFDQPFGRHRRASLHRVTIHPSPRQDPSRVASPAATPRGKNHPSLLFPSPDIAVSSSITVSSPHAPPHGAARVGTRETRESRPPPRRRGS